MDAATIWGLVITVAGTAASIWGAIISLNQATAAKASASEASRVRDQLINQRGTSDLAGLKVHCERAIKCMEKYGPGAPASSLSGVNPVTDASDVRTLILEANQLQGSFHKGEVQIFVNKVGPLLDTLVSLRESRNIQPNGRAVLMEVSNFLAVIKAALDAKRESASTAV